MTLIVDAGPLFVQADARSRRHREIVGLLRADRGPLVTTTFAACEADYFIDKRLGVDVELRFLDDLAEGTFDVAPMGLEDIRRIREVARRYRDLRLGLTDASLVVLAERLNTTRILTFDERHFRAIEPLQGGHFTILPADAPARDAPADA